MNARLQWMAVVLCLVITGCAGSAREVTGSGSQLQARQIQTRDYDTLDKQLTMRSVLATMQDLGFTIDNADLTLGTITGTRIYYEGDYENFTMRMTVTVREKDGNRSLSAQTPGSTTKPFPIRAHTRIFLPRWTRRCS